MRFELFVKAHTQSSNGKDEVHQAYCYVFQLSHK